MRSFSRTFAAITFVFLVLPSFAVEPWADKTLSVTNGLEIWLDAAKKIAARSQTVTKGPRNRLSSKLIQGGPLGLWHDASGNNRNALQLAPSARPKFFRTAVGGFVRFDGADDFLAATGFAQEFGESTIPFWPRRARIKICSAPFFHSITPAKMIISPG